MAKYQKAELRVAFRIDDSFLRIYTLKLRGDELYALSHDELIGGKSSYHDSGVRTREVDLLNLREWDAGEPDSTLRDTRLIRYISGVGMGARVSGLTERRLKRDTRERKTLILDSVADFERFTWGFDVWAVSQDYLDAIPMIAKERPWRHCPVIGSVAANWTQPALLITVWRAEIDMPYTVYKFSPAVPGRVPFEVVPAAYEDTWLNETVNGARLKWRPEDPWPPDDPVGIPQAPPRGAPHDLWVPQA